MKAALLEIVRDIRERSQYVDDERTRFTMNAIADSIEYVACNISESEDP